MSGRYWIVKGFSGLMDDAQADLEAWLNAHVPPLGLDLGSDPDDTYTVVPGADGRPMMSVLQSETDECLTITVYALVTPGVPADDPA